MSDFIEFSGKTTEDALRGAADHFQLPLDRLEVEVVSAGSSGLFGLLGAKKAKVRVRPQAGPGLAQELAELAAAVSDNHRPLSPPPAPTSPDNGQETVIWEAKPAPATPAVRPDAEEDTIPWPAKPGPTPPSASPKSDEDTAPWAAKPHQAQDGESEDEAGAAGDQRLEQDPQVLAHALEVLNRLVSPLDDTATVTAQAGPQGIELSVQGQEVGVLIGRRGQNLEALQYLVTRIVSHRCGRPVRIIVDAGEYRRRRRESLEELAQRMAQKARQSGRAVAVGPLSAQERRVVHMALKGEPGLTTSSRGRGELKKVVISPRP
ncbi:MAG: RNA-binding cell elongation regulator Jag/EloR [Pseudomonadota bacterium]